MSSRKYMALSFESTTVKSQTNRRLQGNRWPAQPRDQSGLVMRHSCGLRRVTERSLPENLCQGRALTSQHGKATIDMNADFNGRRPSGDARLDLAAIDRHFRI